jgi:hypothetical protein|tara:strand:+ start:182 stop:595 length:414 start_codon:yes stop_codon:yes gene_type:complete
MDEIYRVQPQNLETVLPFLMEGLDVCERHAPVEWRQEEVVASVATGASELWVGFKEDVLTGFLIFYMEQRPTYQQMVVWVIYGRGIFEEIPWLKQQARQRGVERILFATRREGFERIADKYGFEYVHSVYQMDVNDG